MKKSLKTIPYQTNAHLKPINIHSEKVGKIRLINPFDNDQIKIGNKAVTVKNGVIELEMKTGEEVVIQPKSTRK